MRRAADGLHPADDLFHEFSFHPRFQSNRRDSITNYDSKNSELVFDTSKGPLFNYDGQHRELGYSFRLGDDPFFAGSMSQL